MTHPLSKIFEILADSTRANEIALDIDSRISLPMLAIVSANNDPDNKRRIKINLPSSPSLESEWLYRLTPNPDLDSPVPKIGQTVMALFQDGVETEGFYSCIQNATNPAIASDEPLIDHTESTKGKRLVDVLKDLLITVAGKWSAQIKGNIDIKSNSRITFSNLAGATLTLHEVGVVILQDSLGNQVVLGGQTLGLGYPSDIIFNMVSSNLTLNMNNHSLQLNNCSDLKIGANSVAVVGALVTNGNSVTTKGY